MKLAAVLLSVQVLSQTVLDFRLSIGQILVTIGVAAAVEVVVTLQRRRALTWPARAVLTGNSIALLLRASGTAWRLVEPQRHRVLRARRPAVAAGQFLIRPTDRHLFNPFNVELVLTFRGCLEFRGTSVAARC